LHADAYHQFLPFILNVVMFSSRSSARKSKPFIVNPPLLDMNRERVGSLVPVY